MLYEPVRTSESPAKLPVIDDLRLPGSYALLAWYELDAALTTVVLAAGFFADGLSIP